MILPSTFVRISLAAVLAIAAVGCRKGDKNLTPIPGGSGNFAGGGNDNPAGSMMSGGNQFSNNDLQTGDDIGNGAGNLNGSGLPNNPDSFTGKTETRLESSIIYFDFDSYSVKPSELPKIVTVAEKMTEIDGSLMRVEGHCDERGTEEYNRALGERRALSIRDVLVQQGISPTRITTESWGEDRPATEGETESAFAENRRGEFVLLTQ